MVELKKIKVKVDINKSPTLNCTKCKFNTIRHESLQIHIKNVHEPQVLKCRKCSHFLPSDKAFKTHMRIHKSKEKQPIVIKRSLNLINGEAGGLPDPWSNPKRGQVYKNCNVIVKEKRDKKSIKTGSNYQSFKKDSTIVDKQSGFNYQII